MKDHLKRILDEYPVDLKKNMAREYLQAKILGFIQEKKGFASWVFHGGTALRFLFDLPRFSEELDFSLNAGGKQMEFRDLTGSISRSFSIEGYKTDLKYGGRQPIDSAFIRFPGLPQELGFSPHPGEVLSVKIEIDTAPPSGGRTMTTIIRRHLLLNILHYDRSTMLAGKLHAILSRPYCKGRDLYDLFWYLSGSSRIEPNFGYLNQALSQTGWPGPSLLEKNWRHLIKEHLKTINWRQAVSDVRPFIERKGELELLTLQNLEKMLV